MHRTVKIPWIFPGAPLILNGAPGNIQGNLITGVDAAAIYRHGDGYKLSYESFLHHTEIGTINSLRPSDEYMRQ